MTLRGLRVSDPLGWYLLCAAGLYGLSVALPVLTVNRFKPIRGTFYNLFKKR